MRHLGVAVGLRVDHPVGVQPGAGQPRGEQVAGGGVRQFGSRRGDLVQGAELQPAPGQPGVERLDPEREVRRHRARRRQRSPLAALQAGNLRPQRRQDHGPIPSHSRGASSPTLRPRRAVASIPIALGAHSRAPLQKHNRNRQHGPPVGKRPVALVPRSAVRWCGRFGRPRGVARRYRLHHSG